MADSKISALTAATTVTGVEELPIVQSATTVKVTINVIKAFFIGLFESLSNKQNSLATDGTGTKYPTVDAINANVIKGTLGTTGIGSQIPYNNGVANTVVGSDNFTMYNVGINTALSLKTSMTNSVLDYSFIEGGSYAGMTYFGSAYASTQFAGTTNLYKAQTLYIYSGNNQNFPIVITGSPIINYVGVTGTNAATRLGTLGFRIGTAADCDQTNTARLEIVAGSATIPYIKLNTGTILTTPINGVVEYDGTDLMITARGTRQNIMKGLRGTFSTTATAQTAFTVTFGGTQPNNTYFVGITATATLSASSNYISARTTTSFTVTFLTGLTGTITFDWQLIQ